MWMSAREVLRLLLQIAEDMNSVLGLPSAFAFSRSISRGMRLE